jgi:TATA-binding protein-associated factor Taf7
MRRTNKKDLNLNKLKTGCSPCLNEVQKMQQKLSDRKVSEIKIEEIKKIVSSLFKKD